jgi:hypothetical protein
MATYEYKVLAFRQQKSSPVQVAFVAHAGEVLKWAGIPRKSDELLTGFQRFKDDDRIEKQIVPFFQYPENCSPTAVIVALRKSSGLGTCRLAHESIPPGEVVSTLLTVEVDSDALLTDKVFENALRYVNQRLVEDTSPPEPLTDSDDDDDNATEDLEEEDENEGNGEPTIHLGSETLARMRVHLEDKANWENPNFKKAIADYVKPAFLIDGQHRIFAAARLGEKGLPFMICGLYDAPWDEQVFQFTVVNLKPKRIPPSLITSIAALSLSQQEQNRLQGRLNQAGVKMTEVEIMSLVAYDDRSPFAELVDMGVGQGRDPERVGYGAMKRVAKVWHRAGRNSLTQIAKQLFESNNATHARARWRIDRIWFDFFAGFWSALRDHYPDSLWKRSEENNLLIGASLWALQEALLIEADGQMPSHWKVPSEITADQRQGVLMDRLLEVVRTSLVYLPAEMWTIPWTKSSLDTNQGRDEVRDLFRKLIDEGKKEGRVWKHWKNEEWFKSTP